MQPTIAITVRIIHIDPVIDHDRLIRFYNGRFGLPIGHLYCYDEKCRNRSIIPVLVVHTDLVPTGPCGFDIQIQSAHANLCTLLWVIFHNRMRCFVLCSFQYLVFLIFSPVSEAPLAKNSHIIYLSLVIHFKRASSDLRTITPPLS